MLRLLCAMLALTLARMTLHSLMLLLRNMRQNLHLLLYHPHQRLLRPLLRYLILHPRPSSMDLVVEILRPTKVYTMHQLLPNHNSQPTHILCSQFIAILKILSRMLNLPNKLRHEHNNWSTLEDQVGLAVPAITMSGGRWLPIPPVDLILPMRRPHLISHLQHLMRPLHQHQLCKPPMHTA
jgi:hypothetical protein